MFPDDDYISCMEEHVADESEFVTILFSDAAIEKIAAAGGDTTDLPRAAA